MSSSIHTPRKRSFWQSFAGLVHLLAPQRAGLLLLVLLPTALTTLYYGIFASDIFVSESAFSVRLEQGHATATDVSTIFPGLMANGAGQHDQLTVNTFIKSRGAVATLPKSTDLQTIYRSTHADWLARLRPAATQEDLLKYYNKMVTVNYDERAMISTLKVRAFTADEAHALNEAILTEAEQFVNDLSRTIRDDSIRFATEQVATAEQEMLNANKAVTEFRDANRNFDPTITSQGALQVVQGLEEKLIEKHTERDALRGVMTEQNPRMKFLNREIATLEAQVKQQNTGLTSDKPKAISRQLEDYASLALKQEFAAKRYAMALAAFEAAQAEASRKTIYLARVVAPSLPDEATEPRRLHHIASVFFLSLAGYAMLMLIAMSVADHIRR